MSEVLWSPDSLAYEVLYWNVGLGCHLGCTSAPINSSPINIWTRECVLLQMLGWWLGCGQITGVGITSFGNIALKCVCLKDLNTERTRLSRGLFFGTQMTRGCSLFQSTNNLRYFSFFSPYSESLGKVVAESTLKRGGDLLTKSPLSQSCIGQASKSHWSHHLRRSGEMIRQFHLSWAQAAGRHIFIGSEQ